ncbi:MAG: hypothetical protein AVDCRST_MAG59-5078, partial [uncultured Thermomicrobiales bacterium]
GRVEATKPRGGGWRFDPTTGAGRQPVVEGPGRGDEVPPGL